MRTRKTQVTFYQGVTIDTTNKELYEFDTVADYDAYLNSNGTRMDEVELNTKTPKGAPRSHRLSNNRYQYVHDGEKIRINASFENVQGLNYMKIVNLEEDELAKNNVRYAVIDGVDYISDGVCSVDWHTDLNPYIAIKEWRQHLQLLNGVVSRRHFNEWLSSYKNEIDPREIGLDDGVQPSGGFKLTEDYPLRFTGTGDSSIAWLCYKVTGNLGNADGIINNHLGSAVGVPSMFYQLIVPYNQKTGFTVDATIKYNNGKTLNYSGGVHIVSLMTKMGSDPKLGAGANTPQSFFYTKSIGLPYTYDPNSGDQGKVTMTWEGDIAQDWLNDYQVANSDYHLIDVVSSHYKIEISDTATYPVDFAKEAIAIMRKNYNGYIPNEPNYNLRALDKAVKFSLIDGRNAPTDYTVLGFNNQVDSDTNATLKFFRMGSMGSANRVVYGALGYNANAWSALEERIDGTPMAYNMQMVHDDKANQQLDLMTDTYTTTMYQTQGVFNQGFKNAELSLNNLKVSQDAQQANLAIGQSAQQQSLGVSQAAQAQILGNNQGLQRSAFGLQTTANFISGGLGGLVSGGLVGAATGLADAAGNALVGGTMMGMQQDTQNANQAVQQGAQAANLGISQGASQAELATSQQAASQIGMNNYENAIQNIRAKQYDLSRAPDTIQFQGGNSYFEGGYNLTQPRFIISTISFREFMQIDFIYSALGYETNEMCFNMDHFETFTHSRKEFNYIQMKSVKLVGDGFLPIEYIKGLEAMLVNGVTFWHNPIAQQAAHNLLNRYMPNPQLTYRKAVN